MEAASNSRMRGPRSLAVGEDFGSELLTNFRFSRTFPLTTSNSYSETVSAVFHSPDDVITRLVRVSSALNACICARNAFAATGRVARRRSTAASGGLAYEHRMAVKSTITLAQNDTWFRQPAC